MTGSDERRTQSVVFGVIAACIFYTGSLVLQRWVPAVKEALIIDLGPGVRPAYYLRVALSLAVGVVFFLGARLARRRAVSERTLAWTAGILFGVAMLAVMLFP